MANPTISQIKVGDTTYDLCDEETRNYLFPLTQEPGVLKHGTELTTESKTYVEGATSASLMANKTVLNANSWDPVLGIQTKEGGSWTIGNYNNEGLQFVYFSAEKIANNNNTPNASIIFNSDGTTNLKNNIYFDNTTSRTKNTVLAAPNGSNGVASFRALVAADIPNLNASKITAGTLGVDRIPAHSTDKLTSGTLPLGRGGTGATTKLAAFTNIGAWSSSLGSTSGTTSKNITITRYNELLICATYSSTYRSTIVVPTGLIDGTVRDWYLGAWSTTYAASCKLSKTTANNVVTLTITPYNGLIAGSEKSFSWYVYGR